MDVLVRNTVRVTFWSDPEGKRGRQAKNTPKSALLLTFYGNLPWFIRLIHFSLHCVENYDSCCSNSDHKDAKKSKKEPDSATEGLIAGLGDAEGSKEGGCEGFQESHSLMVRGWCTGGADLRCCMGIGGRLKNPQRY